MQIYRQPVDIIPKKESLGTFENSISNKKHFNSTLKQMRKNTEYCLEVDLQQHIRSTQQYTKPSKMHLYGTHLFVCVCWGQICAAMVVRRCEVCRGLAGHRQAVLR